jgi:hypothetical protein
LELVRPRALDHDDFGLIQSKIMNVIDSNNVERDMQISLRNLRKLDCAGKPVPTFPHPALRRSRLPMRLSDDPGVRSAILNCLGSQATSALLHPAGDRAADQIAAALLG